MYIFRSHVLVFATNILVRYHMVYNSIWNWTLATRRFETFDVSDIFGIPQHSFGSRVTNRCKRAPGDDMKVTQIDTNEICFWGAMH